MANIAAIIIIVILVVIIIAEVIIALYTQSSLKECQANQGASCYTYLCDSNLTKSVCANDPCLCYPSRIGADKKKYCGIAPYSAIPPSSTPSTTPPTA